MDANNEFDKLIKDKLTNNTQEVPSELKSALESRLVKEGFIKKGSGNNGRWFLLSLSVIAILAIFAGGYSYFSDKSDLAIASTIDSEKNEAESKLQLGNYRVESEISVKKNSNTALTNKVRINKESQITIQKNQKGSTLNASTNKWADKNEADHSNSINNLSAFEKTKKIKYSNSKIIVRKDSASQNSSGDNKISESNISANNEAVSDKNDQVPDPVSDIKFEVMPPNNITSNYFDRNSGPTNDKKYSDDESASVFKQDSQQNDRESESLLTAEIKDDMRADSQISDTTVIAGSNISPYTNSRDSVKNDSAFVSRYSVEAFAGLQLTMKQGASASGSSGGNGSSSQNSEVIVGLKLNYFISNLTLGTGINYSKHTSKIATVFNTYFQDTSGFQIPVSLPGTVITDYSIIDIPVLIGYNFPMKKVAIHVESGVSFSLISKATSILAIDNTNIVIDNFSLLTLEKSYLNYVGQVSFLYSLNRRLQFFVQPSISYGLSGIFKQLPDEKINVFSLKAGLRFNF